MSDAEGFFTKPWRGDETPPPAPPAAPSAPDAGRAATGEPLASFPSRDVSAAAEAQIAALAPDPETAGWATWQAALTCITVGLGKCDILVTLAKHSPEEGAEALVAAEMDRERAELTALQAHYQRLCDDYEASMERANAILQKAHQESMAEEAKRQKMRDEVAAAESKQAHENWVAGTKRADESHKQFMGYLTNKYWSQM